MLVITNTATGERLEIATNDIDQGMQWDEAIQACENLGNGWRLPTITELKLIYNELHLKGEGNFKLKFNYDGEDWDIDYWSITECNDYGEDSACSLHFASGRIEDSNSKDNTCFVRAVRTL